MRIIDQIPSLLALFGIYFTYKASKESLKASKENSKKTNEVATKLGELSAETQGKQRVIGTVSVQRVEWINKVREYFSQLHKLTYQIALLRSKGELIKEEYMLELYYLLKHIELLLNPTENITKNFIKTRQILISYLLNDREDFSFKLYFEMEENLQYLEQVILKSEWKRLKEETRSGDDVKNMETINKETAQSIDIAKYNIILKKDFDK